VTAAKRLRTFALIGVAVLLLAVWAFPVLWALLTSFKTERDVLAYPPTIVFEPTLRNYRDVLFGSASILPNLLSSTIVAGVSTALTLLFGARRGSTCWPRRCCRRSASSSRTTWRCRKWGASIRTGA
jgi:ABC-type glycerol-3-phosphate transport system permease component